MIQEIDIVLILRYAYKFCVKHSVCVCVFVFHNSPQQPHNRVCSIHVLAETDDASKTPGKEQLWISKQSLCVATHISIHQCIERHTC